MADKDDKQKTPITIKKYANRRLYNTATSSYVTLETLATMVKNGDDFLVYDAKTGEDITRSVLTQIIFEEEAKGESLLPINFLRQLIPFYGDSMGGFVPSYLELSLEAFKRNQEQMRRAFTGNSAMTPMETMARQNMDWFQNAMRMFSPFQHNTMPGATPPGASTPAPARDEPRDRSEIEDLKAQVEAMRAALDDIAGRKG